MLENSVRTQCIFHACSTYLCARAVRRRTLHTVVVKNLNFRCGCVFVQLLCHCCTLFLLLLLLSFWMIVFSLCLLLFISLDVYFSHTTGRSQNMSQQEEEEKTYDINTIVDAKHTREQLFLKVSWTGFPDASDNTW